MTDAENTTIDLGGELQPTSITNTNTGYHVSEISAAASVVALAVAAPRHGDDGAMDPTPRTPTVPARRTRISYANRSIHVLQKNSSSSPINWVFILI